MQGGIAGKLAFLENNSRFKALFLLLLRSEDYIKSEKLAKDLGVTSRTIKNDLKNLKNALVPMEITLESRQSKGYRLIIGNPELEVELKAYFQIYQLDRIDNEFDVRVNYITRRLLVSAGWVKTETLQDELCMNSTNSLNRELARVKQFLAGYRLELVVQPHYGMRVTGAEFAKVAGLVRMYKFFSKDLAPEFHIEDYNCLFACEKREKNEIRKIFLKTISGSRIVFSDIYAERFVIYLIYFRNKRLGQETAALNMPGLDFDETVTEEFRLVKELTEKLRIQMDGFDFGDEVIRFLTYVAIISTDLYRFRDCTRENYGTLMDLAEETRNFMLTRFSEYLQINMFDDFTCIKDLLKIMLPISLKIWLGISDDADLGFHNVKSMEERPVLCAFMEKLAGELEERYHYRLSVREKYLIFHVFLGRMNRIVLPHVRLRLAIIAINGRLSTQQLKFNLQHYFSDFIEKIETRVLYELEFMENRNYDYYLCMEYGKNMHIPYEPIYFADEEMTETEYVESLSHVFFDAYKYDEVLPPVRLEELADEYRFGVFPVELFLEPEVAYEKLCMGSDNEIRVYFSFRSVKEQVKVFYFPNREDMTICCEKYFMVIDLMVKENQQKLKMILNVIEQIAERPELLEAGCSSGLGSYKFFFLNSLQERKH